MRAIRKVSLFVAVMLVAVLGAVGCNDEGVCEPCPANADGVPLCKTVEGIYYAELTGESGDCVNPDVLSGDVRVDVANVAAGTIDGEADGDPITAIEITLTDEQGNNTRFKGTICDKTEDQAPFTYRFQVSYDEFLDVENFQINNVISGQFRDEVGGDPPVYTISAVYTVNLGNFEMPENSCSMQASLETLDE